MNDFITSVFEPVYTAPADQESINAYADVTGSKIDTYSKSKICYTCKNTDGANSINWKVLSSNDDVSYIEAQAEATLTFGSIGSYTNTLATYRYYKVQIKATVGGSQGDAQVRGFSKV